MQKREGRSFAPPPTIPVRPDLGRTGRKALTPQAAMPPLTSALSRRAALFGAVAVAGASVAALPAKAEAVALSANDARLVAIADEITKLDRFVEAYPPMGHDEEEDHPAYYEAIDSFCPLEDEMSALPADTMAGVLAKVRASMVPTCREIAHGLADSVVADLARLHGGGMA